MFGSRPINAVDAGDVLKSRWFGNEDSVSRMRKLWDPLSLSSIFLPVALGRKFGDLVQNELTDLRDAVAHALSDVTGSMTISADEALHLDRVNMWIPLMKCVVRRMLKNEFPEEFLPEAGGY